MPEVMPIPDHDKCIGCGSCTRDCGRMLFGVKDHKVYLRRGVCMDCGHCVAICPTGAIRLSGKDETELIEYTPQAFDLDPQVLLHAMKFRRSMRSFRQHAVEDEKLALLIEAGRYAPSGSNRQKTRYILLREQKDALMRNALETLHEATIHMDDIPALHRLKHYREKWERLYYDLVDRGQDHLFHGAPCVLLVVACDPASGSGELDAGLASANIELMAHALGLGACYIGFFSFAVGLDPDLAAAAGIRADEKIISTLALGYPAHKYYRTVNRCQADVTLL